MLPTDKYINLVPEDMLVQSLSPLWQQRFSKAITLLQENLEQPFDWNSICRKCAVSASHFHTLFRSLYGETPAQYHRRMRIKQVLYSLYMHPDLSITEIALAAGFASSQSLAKVLKRTLGVSAQEIRRQPSSESFDSLRHLLEHPQLGEQRSVERELVDTMAVNLVQWPERHLFMRTVDGRDSARKISRFWNKLAPNTVQTAVALTPWGVIEQPDINYRVGYECSAMQANTYLPAGNYLRCCIRVKDISTYIAASEALYLQALRSGYELRSDCELVEVIHNPRDILSLRVDFSLLLPVI